MTAIGIKIRREATDGVDIKETGVLHTFRDHRYLCYALFNGSDDFVGSLVEVSTV